MGGDLSNKSLKALSYRGQGEISLHQNIRFLPTEARIEEVSTWMAEWKEIVAISKTGKQLMSSYKLLQIN